MKCNNCENLENGSIIMVKEIRTGTVCSKCGIMLYGLSNEVPWFRKIKIWFLYPKSYTPPRPNL